MDLITKNSLLLLALMVIGILTTLSSASAQELRTYLITCDSAEFQYLITHPEENDYIDCEFQYDGNVYQDVRIRLKGGEHRFYPKKSFKVNFDRNNRFFDRDKMNLMAEWNDPSFAREYLAFDLLRRVGLPASETWFARLYINGAYWGLYLDVEQVDELMLARLGLNDQSSIYKADSLGCLLTVDEPVEELWDKNTNKSTGYYDLNQLIETLNYTPDESLAETIGHLFPPTELPRFIAANALLGNIETYFYNYYLVNDLSRYGCWRIFAREMEKTFYYSDGGGNPCYFRAGFEGLEATNTLITRCWLNRQINPSLFTAMQAMMDSIFTQSYYLQKTNELRLLLQTAVSEDTHKQFTLQQFYSALNEIPQLVSSRAAALRGQLVNAPLPFNIERGLLTPEGVYFSWKPAYSTGNVTYRVELAEDSLFAGPFRVFDASSSTSYMTNAISPGRYFWRVIAAADTGFPLRSIAFYNAIEIPLGAFAGTTVTGIIDTSTTWTLSESPYRLPQGLEIADGAVLTIEPGVMVGIGPEKSIRVQGGITAIGTETDSIRLVPLNPDSNWCSITAYYPSDEIFLSHMLMTGGGKDSLWPFPSSGAMIQVLYGSLSIYDSHLSNGEYGAVVTHESELHLERALFEHFDHEIVFQREGGSVTARSCVFAFGHQGTQHYDLLDIGGTTEPSEVSNCRFLMGRDDIIDLDNVHNLLLNRNIVVGAGDKGISVGSHSDSVRITNNIIQGCFKGIGLHSNCSAELFNNVFAHNYYGIFISAPGDTGRIVVKNTVFAYFNRFVYTSPGYDFSFEHCMTTEDTLLPGSGNLLGDPRFTDPWNGNYYPLEDSPLIDAGYGAGHPELDFNLQPRIDIPEVPNTGAGAVPYVDIGVYEYNPDYQSVSPRAKPVSTFTLFKNHPNPFNAVTRISFAMTRFGSVEIAIFDVLGRQVFKREFEELPPGEHSLLWNGRTDSGIPLSSGIYFCRLQQEKFNKTIKLLLLK